MITAQYIKEFFEKKERQSALMVKTRYGKSLSSQFAINEKKAEVWLAERLRKKSQSVSNP